MKPFLRNHAPLLAVAALLALGCALAYGGYIDPTLLSAAPLAMPFFAIGDTQLIGKQHRELLAKRSGLLEASAAFTSLAEKEKRDLTDDEKKAIDANLAAVAAVDTDVSRLQRMIDLTRAAPAAGVITESRPNVLDDPKRGFKSFAEFARAVRMAGLGNRAVDERLLIGAATPGTYGNENAGVDGGYLVPTEFSREITKLALEVDSFLPMTDQMPVSGNSITFPSDETTPWGSNGVRAYWAAEAAAATATKPIIKPNTMRLNKLFALTPVTDELLEDSPAIAAYLTGLMGRSIKWKINDAIINGTGAGQPLGIANANALVTISKESGQATLTYDPKNFAKMYAAMPADYLADAFWIIGPDCLPYLMTLTLGNFAIWTPPTQGFAYAPGGFLFGKPVVLSQTAKAFSSLGDTYFVNLKAYRTISKDGVEIAESMHLYFDADSVAYRATFRIDGQPTFKSSITQARGSQALSPYVTLQAR